MRSHSQISLAGRNWNLEISLRPLKDRLAADMLPKIACTAFNRIIDKEEERMKTN
jgi:hypothetical protein